MKIARCWFGFWLAVSGCGSTNERPAHPSAGTAAQELEALIEFVEQVHPRPFAYLERESLHALVEAEAQRLDALGQPDDIEVGLSLHRVLAALGDGHLALALPSFQLDAPHPVSLLPLLVKHVGEHWFVDATAQGVPPGTALLSLDGEAIETVWASLLPLAMVDARNPVAREAALDHDFASFYHIAHGMRPQYRAVIRLPDGREQTLTLAGTDRTGLLALENKRLSAPIHGGVPAAPDQPAWPTLVRLDARTVLLRLPSFGIMDIAGYQARIDEIFAGLSGEDVLVLDLRGNEGGYRQNGIAVLNHVLAKPYTEWTSVQAAVQEIPDEYRAQVSFPFVPEQALKAPFAGVTAGPDGYRFLGDPLAQAMMPKGSGYRGAVRVFIDGLTASASVDTLSGLLHARPDVKLIGSETAGECGRHVGEMPVMYTTKLHGIRLLVSLFALTHVTVKGCTLGHGYVPDWPVSYGEDAFVNGQDLFQVVLEAHAND